MVMAQQGLLERQCLEDSCFIADEEIYSLYVRFHSVFASQTSVEYLYSSLGADSPPLSSSDGLSISEGSQSSIDLSQLTSIELIRTWEDFKRVFMHIAKVIVDATQNFTSLDPPSMKLLKRKSVQLHCFEKG